MLLAITGLALCPLVGRVIDRFGARWIALLGIPLFALAIGTVGLAGPSIWSWYAAWGFLLLVFPMICPIVWTSAIVARFKRVRGTALGIMFCGSGVASTAGPLIAVAALEHFGWRGVYFTLGALALALMFPLAFFLFRDVRRAAPDAEGRNEEPEAPRDLELKRVIRTAQFWKLAIPLGVASAVASGLGVHLQPTFTDAGLAMTEAAAMMAIIGPARIAGRLMVGYLLDIVPGPSLAAVTLALPAVSMALLLHYDGSLVTGLIAAAALGIAHGAENDLMAYLTSRYFGVKNYGSIFGALYSVTLLGFGAGPMIFGVAFDITGSYRTLMMVIIPLVLVTSIVIASLGRYPQSPDSDSHT
jgi:MFS family permease